VRPANPLDWPSKAGIVSGAVADGQTAYTRSGEFHMDAQGNVVTANGIRCSPRCPYRRRPSITMPRTEPWSVTLAGQPRPRRWAACNWPLFPDPGGLNSVGQNLYLATTASGDAASRTPAAATAWDR